MTKSLGQKLWEAKEKYYVKKGTQGSAIHWSNVPLMHAEWKAYAKTLAGKDDMHFYLTANPTNMNTLFYKIKKKKQIRYLNREGHAG